MITQASLWGGGLVDVQEVETGVGHLVVADVAVALQHSHKKSIIIMFLYCQAHHCGTGI